MRKGMMKCSVLLNTGYYNYGYVTIDKTDPKKIPSFEFTEGNNLETKMIYILVYIDNRRPCRINWLVAMFEYDDIIK